MDHEATAKRLLRGWRTEDGQRLLPNPLVALECRVAAALAAAEARGAGEIRRLADQVEAERQAYRASDACNDDLTAEIARLRAQLGEAEKMNVTIIQNSTAMRTMLEAERDAAKAYIKRIEIHHGETETRARGRKNGTADEQIEYWRTRYLACSNLADGWEETCLDAQRERDAAEVKALERAKEICKNPKVAPFVDGNIFGADKIPFVFRNHLADAIQAEIDKAGKKE